MCQPEGSKECKVVIVKHGAGDCDMSDIQKLHAHHQAMMKHHGSCCCGPEIQRHFISSTEKIEGLEKYKSDLEKELAGVKEAIDKHRED